MAEVTIPVLVDTSPDKSIFDKGALAHLDLPLDKLGVNLAELTRKLNDMVAATWKAEKELQLSEIQVGVEITAEAGVSLVGTAKAGGSASIVLSFKRA